MFKDQFMSMTETTNLQSDHKGTIAAISVALIWGLSFVAARLILTTLSPVTLATTRFIIASIIYTPIIIREIPRGYKPNKNELKDLCILGILSISIYFWLQYTGVQYAGAGISAVLVTGLIPVLTGVISSLLLREKFTLIRGIKIIIGLIGVTLIAIPKLIFGQIDWLFFLGVGCLIGDAVCWAMYSTLSRKLIQKTGKPLMVTAYTTVLGTIFLIPMSLLGDWNAILKISLGQWIAVFYLALICSSVGYLLWNYALSRLETVKASVWLYLEPIAAFIGEAILFGVFPSSLTLLGGACIIISAILISREK